ncbi:pantetheine-phosphate adenylyltransferase [Ethanoligenens sp.]|uniref:pantetheine-phosphate adenylyltransferase n=1 Tax=Ethanoligenens sp. TaxID=2099655 RepID=UPI0039E892B5
MSLAICPGSFDPLTLGHLDIISRAANMFDHVVVVVMANSGKNPAFTVQERYAFIQRSVCDLPGVEVDTYDGLLADYCALRDATAVVRGLRVMSDFEYEFQMALTNNSLHAKTETIFLPANREYMFLSSSVVREIARYGRDISTFVPRAIAADIQAKLCGKEIKHECG